MKQSCHNTIPVWRCSTAAFSATLAARDRIQATSSQFTNGCTRKGSELADIDTICRRCHATSRQQYTRFLEVLGSRVSCTRNTVRNSAANVWCSVPTEAMMLYSTRYSVTAKRTFACEPRTSIAAPRRWCCTNDPSAALTCKQ